MHAWRVFYLMNLLMKIRINTKDTYRIFYQLHGGEPVIHGNRLLFRDGWSYSRVAEERGVNV